MTRSWMVLALALTCSPASPAWSGMNVFTNRAYRTTGRDGCDVRCSGWTCRHGCRTITVEHDGIRYRGRVQVFRNRGRGEWGLRVRVKASSMNGMVHGFGASLLADGTAYRLPPYAPGMAFGFGSGTLGFWRLPKLRPGKPVTMLTDYPSGRGAGLKPGYRLYFRVRVENVRPAGARTKKKQHLFTVVLTVPMKGPPRVLVSPKKQP